MKQLNQKIKMFHKKINVQYEDTAPEVISFRLLFEEAPTVFVLEKTEISLSLNK